MDFKPQCKATGIGSFPHQDAADACESILNTVPEIPLWPQLANIDFREQMEIQFSEGLPCVVLDEAKQRMYFDTSGDPTSELEKFYENYMSENLEYFKISPDYGRGIYEMEKKLSEKNLPSVKFFKSQVTGPVTFGLAIVDESKRAIYYNDVFRDVVVKGITMKARWVLNKLKPLGYDQICFVDEPILSAFGSSTYVSVQRADVVTFINEVIEAVHKEGALAGAHCCGNTEWPILIDAGTNGELVVGNKDWLMTCACSAGPAFEGSGIKCGMPASEGAIEEIKMLDSGKFEYKVIGGTKPKGICGSGLVDLLAELFIHGYIDRHGKYNEKKAAKKIVETEEGKGFLVEEGKNSFWGKDLIITENDISNLIRTKGAVFSACSLLLKNVGLSFNRIDSFYIAGGFGQHLNIENAVRIGLLPDLERDRFHYLGNSSLLGAYLILLSDKNRGLAEEVAQKMTYIELNTEPNYMNEFTGALFLPHTDTNLFPSVKQIFNL